MNLLDCGLHYASFIYAEFPTVKLLTHFFIWMYYSSCVSLVAVVNVAHKQLDMIFSSGYVTGMTSPKMPVGGGGSKGRQKTQNRIFAQPPGGLAPPPVGNTGSAPGIGFFFSSICIFTDGK